jgi:hypothetical protein
MICFIDLNFHHLLYRAKGEMFALICHFRILAAFSVWFAEMYLVPVDEQTWEKFGFFPGIIILIMTQIVGLQSLQGWTDIL